MSSTIFCTFDQQDLADLAIGRLRGSVRGIHSVQYLSDFGGEYSGGRDRDTGYGLFGFNNLFNSQTAHGVQPSRPVSVKIVCDGSAKDAIMGKLVNLHAYRIVAS